jgi:hypothetical protein
MMPKSGNRFPDDIMLSLFDLERGSKGTGTRLPDDDLLRRDGAKPPPAAKAGASAHF